MLRTVAARPGPSGLGHLGRRRVLVTLCLTQVTSWGVLFYAFPVLATGIAADTGWSVVWVTAAFSASQLTAAVVGIPVGRHLDRRGPRAVMSAGSLLAVPAVIGIAAAPGPGWFLAGWLAAGVAMGAVLYPPAMAALTRWYGPRRVRALTTLTLVGGLASTVFAPLTAALHTQLDWRQTYLVLAVVLGVVTVPAHWWGLRGPWPSPYDVVDAAGGPGRANPTERTVVGPAAVVRSRQFLALVVAFALTGLAAGAVVVNLVPLLTQRGVGPGVAAVALGLGGAGQVLGRLGYVLADRHVGVRARTVSVSFAVAATTALLGVLTSTTALILAAVVAGMARGLFTLLQATAVSDRWGVSSYGRLTGLLVAPLMFATALGPWVGAGLAEAVGGHPNAFLILAVLAGGAVLAAAASAPHPEPARPEPGRTP